MKTKHWTHNFILFLFVFSVLILFSSCKKTIDLEPSDSGLFLKFLGGPYNEKSSSLIETTDGSFLVAGSTQVTFIDPTTGIQDFKDIIYLIKTDANGTLLFSKTYKDGVGKFVQPTPDGNLVLLGDIAVTRSNKSIDSDIILVKLTPKGDTIFSKTYGSVDGALFRDDQASALQVLDDGSLLLASNATEVVGLKLN
jgi:hypothetical protein